MKRIDSVNARPDVNGVGKNGFHDNSDISGQDATYLTPDWLNHLQEELCALLEKNGRTLNAQKRDQLYQLLATDDDVIALATATQQKIDTEATNRTTADNQLAVRITFLESFLESFSAMIVNLIYPIGIVIDFAINFNPNNHISGTTWILHGQGKASVGLSIQENDPAWTKSVGTTFGEYQHKLTINEMPSHTHDIDISAQDSGVGTRPDGTNREDERNLVPTKSAGNDQPHNNVQPSIIDARWRRTA